MPPICHAATAYAAPATADPVMCTRSPGTASLPGDSTSQELRPRFVGAATSAYLGLPCLRDTDPCQLSAGPSPQRQHHAAARRALPERQGRSATAGSVDEALSAQPAKPGKRRKRGKPWKQAWSSRDLRRQRWRAEGTKHPIHSKPPRAAMNPSNAATSSPPLSPDRAPAPRGKTGSPPCPRRGRRNERFPRQMPFVTSPVIPTLPPPPSWPETRPAE